MTHVLKVELDEDDINKAIKSYVASKIDLGVPFHDDDIAIYMLNPREGHVEIVPGRANQLKKQKESVADAR